MGRSYLYFSRGKTSQDFRHFGWGRWGWQAGRICFWFVCGSSPRTRKSSALSPGGYQLQSVPQYFVRWASRIYPAWMEQVESGDPEPRRWRDGRGFYYELFIIAETLPYQDHTVYILPNRYFSVPFTLSQAGPRCPTIGVIKHLPVSLTQHPCFGPTGKAEYHWLAARRGGALVVFLIRLAKH